MTFDSSLDALKQSIQQFGNVASDRIQFDDDENLSTVILATDSAGVHTEIEMRRIDGTLAKKSVLSGGTEPNYATRVLTFYAPDGVTVARTYTYSLTWSGNVLTSETVQSIV